MKQPTVLVLDDDAGILETVARALRTEGYEVRRARSRAEFDETSQRSDIDVYLLDILLPDGSGLKIARELRSRTDAGIILVTGQGDEADRVIGLELGADDYVTKPFHIRELRARVNAVYRRTAPLRRLVGEGEGTGTGTEVIRFHDVEMNVPARRLLDPQGVEVDLTTLEFDVLHALATRPNRVLAREQIMNSVRGCDWAAYDRIVDGVISRLRRKVYPDGTGPQRIKTVRGLGYMLSREA